MNIEKFLAWIRKHWLLTIIISLIGPLLITHILFKINLERNFFAAEWSAGDFLGYIAGFYTFIGTILLGAVTVDQSKQAQEINERLSKENNYFQKVSAQKLMPLIKIVSINVNNSVPASYPINDLNGRVTVTESVTAEKREININIFLPNAKSEDLHVKTVSLSLENISEGAIRQIAVERVEFSGFKLYECCFPPISCYGDEQYKYISDLLLPHEPIEIQVCIYYSDLRHMHFWEYTDSKDIGQFDLCLYLRNTSITDIGCMEKIYIKKADGMKEKIMYRTFEED